MPADELREMARRVLDGNRYMVLASVEEDGRPRLSPVFFTPAHYRDGFQELQLSATGDRLWVDEWAKFKAGR